jgi:hypothetical protein
LILQRKSRRLLNAEELGETARAAGFAVRLVDFEELGVLEQLKEVRCASLFLAVMGAGQQWASFMRPGTTLASIGWKNWKAEYYAK